MVSYPGAAHCALYFMSKSDSMRCEAITAVSVRIVGFCDVMQPSLVLDMVTESFFRPLQIHVASLHRGLFACDAIFGSVFFNHVVMYINFKITCTLNTYFFNSSLDVCMLLDTVRPISIE